MSEPILVVGAGPVGLTLACELLRGGVAVRLIDRLAEPSPWSKAVAVHARTLELLAGMSVVDRFVDESVHVVGATLLADGKTLAEVGFEHVDSDYRYAACLPQTATESILGRLLRELGGSVERAVELVALDQADDCVRSTLRGGDGVESTGEFGYVIGCDGGHSTVRGLVGTQLEGSFEGETFLLVDCDADHSLQRDRIYLVFHPDGLLGLFPLAGKRARLVAQVSGKPDQVPEPTLADAQGIADTRMAGALALRDPRWLTYFEIRNAQVPSYRFGRVFLAGDAAHVHSPAGGQGMNTGMQDAHNLAWKLCLAASGAAAPGLLDSYQAERHPVGAHVVRTAASMTSAVTHRGSLARHSRDFLVSTLVGHTPLRETLARELSEVAVSYHRSPIVRGLPRRTVGHGPLRPGDLAPSVGGLADLLDPTVHTVLLFNADNSVAERMRASFGTLISVVSIEDTNSGIAGRYGAGDGLVAIIRPDRYVAYLGDPADLEGAERTLTLAIG